MIRILVDVDGVLANWIQGACDLLQVENPYLADPSTERLPEKLRMSPVEFWRKIDAGGIEFWENLDLLPEAKELVDYIDTLCYGKNWDWGICTSTTRKPEDCTIGKYRWLSKHFNIRFPSILRRTIITPAKHLCAGPNSILIDDTPAKCDKFKQFGGRSILYPAVSNELGNLPNKLSYIQKCLNSY